MGQTEVVFSVHGPVPRYAPYRRGYRGRPYVPDDLKRWRRRIAKAFLKAGGREPEKNEYVVSGIIYKFASLDHADLDSLTHSVQDALSKDALGLDDKEWAGSYGMDRIYVGTKRDEGVEISVVYHKKE